MSADNDGSLLCAWCGKVMGWMGVETVYSVCADCVPEVRQAVMKRAVQPPSQPTDAGRRPPRRAAGGSSD